MTNQGCYYYSITQELRNEDKLKEEQMGLNMASAFRLRNKLKERIKELTDACRMASVTKARGEAENTTSLDGKSFADSLANVSLLMATLRDFNLAIEKANAVNKEDLITLETLKAEIAFYDTMVDMVRRAEKFDYEYNPDGGRNKIELELVLDQQMVVVHFKELKKKKDAIEEKLAASNFAVQVDFDQEIIYRLL
jgi:acyl carrier protein